MDSEDDDYSGETAVEYSKDDDDGIADGDYNSDDASASCRQQNYIALKEADIREHQENEITTVSTVLSVSRSDASILLRHYRWSVSNVHDVWFADEDGVRKAVGLLESPVVQFPNAKELTCGICFESSPLDGISSAACGHPFCDECWRAYMSTSINGGSGCLMLRCPEPSCGAAIGQDMIDRLVSEEDKERYAHYLLRSYIEDNPKTKWCPGPGCEFEFCWLCLGAYSGHGQCNRYKATDEAERKREMAKMSIQRYTHYYERWATNESSRQKALAGLHEMQTVNLKKLSDKQSQPETQLKFMTEAWLQIVECRRVLKWTYAYGYYLPEPELAKRQFFEYLQGEAEAGLERLHLCAEKDVQAYLGREPPPTDFNDFRSKLAGLTRVTRNYFENLVRAFENGLADVDSQGTSSGKASSREGGPGRDSDDHGSWECDRCTYFNTISLPTCEMCHQPRGSLDPSPARLRRFSCSTLVSTRDNSIP
ncbi:hypothetical protein RHGRI_025727 [Rhododendron griersonianum]|uniref:RBR-type E3 ubiquitin transferase n=1 Tax=Rhododendron griersonianum TaxID=479676 RepID=A0AAV6IQ77_9ERIC|nr:hypothetical protein RHGRI_025727 [Rhododendron griersonianum]